MNCIATSLVRKLSNKPSIVYHFYARARTTLAQEPKTRDLPFDILKSVSNVGNKNASDVELVQP